MILIDAGPLVALIHAGDRNHKRCRDTLRTLNEPMASVWPAVTEAMYLLGFSWKGQQALWEMLELEAVRLLPITVDDAPRMRELMEKYRDLPMDLADAALVHVAERDNLRRIFTLDRDFTVYRRGAGRFTILPRPEPRARD